MFYSSSQFRSRLDSGELNDSWGPRTTQLMSTNLPKIKGIGLLHELVGLTKSNKGFKTAGEASGKLLCKVHRPQISDEIAYAIRMSITNIRG